ncbi:Rne/Rng family ribonuclease [Aquiluna borgnonia]|uniref:Ribonuclease E n=1 Tax=Aquiluna borgnonia TaxID=2499157 RepID=A0A7D4TU19_9MICO|nr:Rne/Rng family ribonuclease [Aquiluna borgnonia]QKJ25155.1 Rne/Rng family ribonuclease [Aquiluna borgnonia]
MPKKKEEPAKPLATQLIFQAPDLPTPKVNPRSGKLAVEEEKPPVEPKAKPVRQQKERPAKQEKTGAEEEKEKDTGSTRVDAKRQRRRDSRDSSRRRSSVTESEFLARRESVDRTMVVREKDDRIQIGVLEDGMLVEHYVAESQGGSLIGNVYLGKVQNVLPSMEAAFVDIGRGRNAVLYSGEVDWEAAETGNQPRRIELALKSGDQVLVQVTKDPVGQKGARLTSQVSLPGRFLVYVPGGNMSGISRKLPEGERQRLKQILKNTLPEDAGVIVRTAAEGASEEQLIHDVERLQAQWESISAKVEKGKAPMLLHSEPDLLVKIIRDVFNEDFQKLVVSGDSALETIREYLESVAPDLVERLSPFASSEDIFDFYRIGDQIVKALDRKVYLPSGGSLVIDRTEAMTVVDVNTGKFIGSGGNLEETVTKNNLEAAEELVRQLRLRDIGGIVVVDFIDMIQESNQEMVRRRLLECLSRDRTKNQVGEITSLGLVQMTRKKIGVGLLETFSEVCDCCAGRGVLIHNEPRFRMPEQQPKQGKNRNKKDKPEVVKKVVTPEQADAFKNVVNKIAQAAHPEDAEVKEPEGKTEILNAVLDSLPEPQPKAKPRRRRASSSGVVSPSESAEENS